MILLWQLNLETTEVASPSSAEARTDRRWNARWRRGATFGAWMILTAGVLGGHRR